MLDYLQFAFSSAIFIAAVGAIISVIMTYRMSVSMRKLEATLRTKEGSISSKRNEEEAKGGRSHDSDVVEGDSDE